MRSIAGKEDEAWESYTSDRARNVIVQVEEEEQEEDEKEEKEEDER